mgnify:CR=1 FL=1
MIRSNWLYIAVMFAVSYTIRILPLTLIRKPNQKPVHSVVLVLRPLRHSGGHRPSRPSSTPPRRPAAGAVALVVGIAAAWFGASLFQVSVACCAVVFVLELFLVH